MSDKNSRSKKIEASGLTSPIQKLGDEWKIFLFGIFRPLVAIPVLFTLIALYFANSGEIDKPSSLILQIMAIIFITIAAGAFYEAIRGIIEANITQKKGISAVRNLSLSRAKANNISIREKEGASPEEIRNLVSLLEKDIVNAIQEWNDIIPGVAILEEPYVMIAEKERELEITKREKVQLSKQLADQQKMSDQEKKELKDKLNNKERRIGDLENQISELRLKTDTMPLGISGYSGVLGAAQYTANPSGSLLGNALLGYTYQRCAGCGSLYTTSPHEVSDSNLCDSCKKTKTLGPGPDK